jgi:hypothetical protein
MRNPTWEAREIGVRFPTDHDYAVPTREYQTDQSSLKPAQAAARSVLRKRKTQTTKTIPQI